MIVQNKNLPMDRYHMLTKMQLQMSMEAVRNGFRISTSIQPTTNLDQKLCLNYSFGMPNSARDSFSGYATQDNDPHFLTMIEILSGRMVSSITPPTLRDVLEDKDDPNDNSYTRIRYWKRIGVEVIEHDVTSLSSPKKRDSKLQHFWVGYSDDYRELTRIQEGAKNMTPNKVMCVVKLINDKLGDVVQVVFNDDPQEEVDALLFPTCGSSGVSSGDTTFDPAKIDLTQLVNHKPPASENDQS